jgi:hypothetical protein
MAYSDGIPIEHTSSTRSSLAMWAISHFSNDFPNNPDEVSELLHLFENHITTHISELTIKNLNYSDLLSMTSDLLLPILHLDQKVLQQIPSLCR